MHRNEVTGVDMSIIDWRGHGFDATGSEGKSLPVPGQWLRVNQQPVTSAAYDFAPTDPATIEHLERLIDDSRSKQTHPRIDAEDVK